MFVDLVIGALMVFLTAKIENKELSNYKMLSGLVNLIEKNL